MGVDKVGSRFRFASLGSGSKGNATVVEAAGRLLLVDCGFSMRDTARRLARLGLEPGQLDAILVTHEHTDHCAGVAALSRRHRIPVYLSHGTHASGRCDGSFELRRFNGDHQFNLGPLEVRAIPVPHDAREPCQYRFDLAGKRLGFLTDLGSVTPHVVDSYRHCDGLLLEFNHDLEMLLEGPYPPGLKRRVAGDWGHLNNDQAVDLLDRLGTAGPACLVAAHLSENNNSRERAARALDAARQRPAEVVWADQSEGFGWLEL